MPKEFKSFYRIVGDNEGSKCHYPSRLDTYGRGCGHDCVYCYAKSQLNMRRKWDPIDPAVADLDKIRLQIMKLNPGSIVRLGGLTDCFQPKEKTYHITYETIKLLNEFRIGYLIVTKSALVASDEYIKILDKELAHIQISVTFTDDRICAKYEKASLPSKRIEAIEKLAAEGFDVTVRLSPLIPGFYDVNVINNIKCSKLLVEFLRNDIFIKRWFDIDWSAWSVKEINYAHLSLEHKIQLLSELTNFKEISVCEDCSEHYDYWKNSFNPNPNDCCNLRISQEQLEANEKRRLNLIIARSNDKRVYVNKAKQIRVTFNSGKVVENKQVAKTFFEVIDYVGGDVVRQLNIQKAGSNIVCENLEEMKEIYRNQAKGFVLSNGMYLFTHMSTEAKTSVLLEISKRTGLNFKIEYT